MPLKREQLAIIHIARKELGLDEDLYRKILQDTAGVSSSKDLNPQSFERLMKRLKKLGFQQQGGNQPWKKDGEALVLPGQMQMIAKLYDDLGWDDRTRRSGFNQRQIGKQWPQTRAEANKIVEGLKAMVRRQQARQG